MSQALLRQAKVFFDAHVHEIVNVPTTMPTGTTVSAPSAAAEQSAAAQWWLAEQIVTHALEDPELEDKAVHLLNTVREAVDQDAFVVHAFGIVDQVMDIMTHAFRDPALKNAFDTENALVTVYYTLMFVMCSAYGSHASRDACSGSVADIIQEHEPFVLCVASLVHKLLVNREVYEFVEECAGCFRGGR